MNKHEMFTKQQIMNKIDHWQIKWMFSKVKDENYKYFEKENWFVIWKFMKWIFEEIVIHLIRCFFYVTEQ